MSGIEQKWIALVTTPWSALGPGKEMVAADYQRIAVPQPLDNGMIPNLSVGALPGWPTVVGWQVWDDQYAGTFLYGADLLWPMGPGGGFTLTFDAEGVASQFDPDASPSSTFPETDTEEPDV
jgi:hypothetical protein